uniref:Uncharacterized protein n=1 Tax=Cacopsylla melanoneura TaxID=428564 RepID=A0A8D9A9W7_9HEMI
MWFCTWAWFWVCAWFWAFAWFWAWSWCSPSAVKVLIKLRHHCKHLINHKSSGTCKTKQSTNDATEMNVSSIVLKPKGFKPVFKVTYGLYEVIGHALALSLLICHLSKTCCDNWFGHLSKMCRDIHFGHLSKMCSEIISLAIFLKSVIISLAIFFYKV